MLTCGSYLNFHEERSPVRSYSMSPRSQVTCECAATRIRDFGMGHIDNGTCSLQRVGLSVTPNVSVSFYLSISDLILPSQRSRGESLRCTDKKDLVLKAMNPCETEMMACRIRLESLVFTCIESDIPQPAAHAAIFASGP